MIPQTFAPTDLIGVLTLVALEALLSADNALVLAVLVRHLPKDDQKRALMYGLVGAFAFRLVALVFAATVLKFWVLQAIGAAYLLYLPISHFLGGGGAGKAAKAKPRSFWTTVLVVELTDIAFAIDSILAGVSFIGKAIDKMWVVYLGAIIGIVLLRIAASGLVALLEKYPVLDKVAYILVGWVGVKLAFLAVHSAGESTRSFSSPEMPHAVFWTGLALIAGVGIFIAYRDRKRGPLGSLTSETSEETSSTTGAEAKEDEVTSPVQHGS